MNEFEKQLARQPLKSVPAEWRTQILNEAKAISARDAAETDSQPWSWLRELFWPCPQAWGALAAVWILMAGFQFMMAGSAPSNRGEVASRRAISISEQRRELARLLDAVPGKSERPPAERPRTARVVPQTVV
jgi:hypothetical protein